MIYNMSNITNANSLVGQIQGVNELSGGLLIGALLVVVFFALVLYNKDNGIITAVLTSSVVLTFLIIGFWGAGMISINFVMYPIILIAFSAIAIFWGGAR